MNQLINTEEDLRQRKELIQQVIDKLADPSFKFRLKSLLMEDFQYCAQAPVTKVIPMPVKYEYVAV